MTEDNLQIYNDQKATPWELRAVIDSMERQRAEWQPIEKAPKGKPGFLALSADQDCIEWLIDWGQDNLLNQNSGNYTVRRNWTHWMTLPEFP